MAPADAWTGAVHQGDALDLLDDLPAESVHAVVTDPPYGLNFMGKDWDNFRRRRNQNDAGRQNVGGRLSKKAPASGAETDMERYQQWCEQWAAKALRVLKPGGHLLAFSGNRTHHRLFSGVEDAGFEVRDTLTWHYGSGFPKALDVGKAIDKAAGAEREVVGQRTNPDGGSYDDRNPEGASTDYGDKSVDNYITAPATDAAEKWDGWKTALKPATEFVVLARAPLSEGTVAENVLEHGTGALNIDGCRIGNQERTFEGVHDQRGGMVRGDNSRKRVQTVTGRYPANVVFDALEAERLDREVGDSPAGHWTGEDTDGYGDAREYDGPGNYGETGGPSRYFYTSKATTAERTMNGRIENPHPTVKPVDLMEWLVKLVTREGQVVLDPFGGSGTTGRACKNTGREFVLIEQDERWADVARARCGLTPENPDVLSDEGQRGLQAFSED